MSNREFISASAESTKNFAKNFARKIKAGDTLALYGDLGSGKTTFIQGLVGALGYKGKVFSPTFILVRPYQLEENELGVKTFYHVDLYRIEKPTDLRTVGIEEFLNENGAVSAIEWPEKIEKDLPANTIKIKLETIDETKRKITRFE